MLATWLIYHLMCGIYVGLPNSQSGDCKNTFCFNSNSIGHVSKQCPSNVKCCISKEESHKAIDCQLSWSWRLPSHRSPDPEPAAVSVENHSSDDNETVTFDNDLSSVMDVQRQEDGDVPASISDVHDDGDDADDDDDDDAGDDDERKTFFRMAPSFFFPNTWPLVGGDFNCYDSVFDKFGGAPSLDSVFKGFKSGCRLRHAWRFKQMLILKEIIGSLGYLKWTKCFPYGVPDPCL